MTWSRQQSPRLDEILNRSDSAHAIAGLSLAVTDNTVGERLKLALGRTALEKSALYVHVPFCPSRCLSCDHLTIIEHDRKEIDHYLETLARELSTLAANTPEGSLQKLVIGGGSPNYLADDQLAQLMASIHDSFTLEHDADVVMEINPRRTSRSQLDLLKGLGVNHLNLEVRDVDTRVQGELGRTQSLGLLEDVLSVARDLEFQSVNMDLLFGLPGQTSASVRESISVINELSPDLIHCQQFTRRHHLFSHQAALDESLIPSLAEKLAIFNAMAVSFEGTGYEWIGLNAFVKPGHPLNKAKMNGELRYNALGYDDGCVSNILGAGIGAVSEIDGLTTQNAADLIAWKQRVYQGKITASTTIEMTDFERARRSVMRHLMCNLPVDIASTDNQSLSALLNSLEDQGYAEKDQGFFRLTQIGRLALPHFWSDSSPTLRWL